MGNLVYILCFVVIVMYSVIQLTYAQKDDDGKFDSSNPTQLLAAALIVKFLTH